MEGLEPWGRCDGELGGGKLLELEDETGGGCGVGRGDCWGDGGFWPWLASDGDGGGGGVDFGGSEPPLPASGGAIPCKNYLKHN